MKQDNSYDDLVCSWEQSYRSTERDSQEIRYYSVQWVQSKAGGTFWVEWAKEAPRLDGSSEQMERWDLR